MNLSICSQAGKYTKCSTCFFSKTWDSDLKVIDCPVVPYPNVYPITKFVGVLKKKQGRNGKTINDFDLYFNGKVLDYLLINKSYTRFFTSKDSGKEVVCWATSKGIEILRFNHKYKYVTKQ